MAGIGSGWARADAVGEAWKPAGAGSDSAARAVETLSFRIIPAALGKVAKKDAKISRFYL
jgi:hypothetical protein